MENLPLILPNRYPIVKSKEPMEKIENYEGLLEPTQLKLNLEVNYHHLM